MNFHLIAKMYFLTNKITSKNPKYQVVWAQYIFKYSSQNKFF